jgi:lysophospholipase L1-like esterase
MDPSSTKRQRQTGSSSHGTSGASDLRTVVVIGALGLVALLAGVAVVGVFAPQSDSPASSGSPPAASLPLAAATTTAAASPSPSTPLPTDTPAPTPQPTMVPLPALLGAIGDSYSQAFSVAPAYLYDHTQFSWVIGTDKNDGVLSLLERFRALKVSPTVVDAATSGKKMDDAARQANLVVAAAKKLPAGQTAYVTIELGTNDLCASPDARTDPAAFDTQLQAAISILRTGLPAGSRILMLSVPDFAHFRAITQASPAAVALLSRPSNVNRCVPYLGTSSPSMLVEADRVLAQYNASLKGACDDIDSHEGTAGQLYCTYNAALLSESDFVLKDLSTVDYFHPSLTGQAKMAESAWKADVWASMPLS